MERSQYNECTREIQFSALRHVTDILEQFLVFNYKSDSTQAMVPTADLMVDFPWPQQEHFYYSENFSSDSCQAESIGVLLASVCKCCWNGDFLHQCFSAETWGTLQWFNVASLSRPSPTSWRKYLRHCLHLKFHFLLPTTLLLVKEQAVLLKDRKSVV